MVSWSNYMSTSVEPNEKSAIPKTPIVNISDRKEILQKNYYFDNEAVERLLHRYVRGACTDVKLRDEIMDHASELIYQVIKAHNLAQIYPGKDDSSMMDLFQVAWVQIESALYKYEALPYCKNCYNHTRPNDSLLYDDYIFEKELIKKVKRCKNCKSPITEDSIYYKGKSRVFNLYSQIARTVILAYIKKENRDRKNSGVFKNYVGNKLISSGKLMDRFITEARELCKYNDEYVHILDCLIELHKKDERAHEGLVSKLIQETGYNRNIITDFFKVIRLRGMDFSDSPINEEHQFARNMVDIEDEQLAE